jgi:hypothetical protein
MGVGILLFVVGALLRDNVSARVGQTLLLAGFVIAFVSTGVYALSFRCPRCRTRISAANVPQGSFLAFPNFCANCGLDFTTVENGDQST